MDKEQTYDSRVDTLFHIKRVAQLLTEASAELIRRANFHDDSKLQSPEKELFDEYSPKLAGCTYGSEEYKGYLKGLKVALDHHYENNTHHPEHYERGVNGFDLFDLIEMFFDWKAAGERHNDGNIFNSIGINRKRFKLSDQLSDILINTAERLGYERPNTVNEIYASNVKKVDYTYEGEENFLCLNCEDDTCYINHKFQYCPNCGNKINWGING